MQPLLARRLETFRALLAQARLDALVIANYSPSASSAGFDYNLFYLTGLHRRYDNAYFLLTPTDSRLCIDALEAGRARCAAALPVHDAVLAGIAPERFAETILKVLRELSPASRPRLGVNGKRLRGSLAIALSASADLVDLSQAIEVARLVKDAEELALFRRACEIAEFGSATIRQAVRVGMSEIELAGIAEGAMIGQGAECMWWFPMLIASGPEAIDFNGGNTPTPRRIAAGDLVHVDICPAYRGYMADIARTMVMGTPTAEQVKVIDLTYRAFEASIAQLKAGNMVGQVRAAMRAVVDGSGFESGFMGPGHGLGLNDDCYPFFGNAADAGFIFADGMTMSVEVGAMVAGLGGVRYEDNFIINGSEPLRLTHAERLVTIAV